MVCDRCGEARAEGSRYCAFCGEEQRDDCPDCDAFRSGGALYCGSCGKRLGHPPVQRPTEPGSDISLAKKLCLVMVPIAALLLIAEFCFMIGGTFTVFDWCATQSMNILGLVPNLVVLTTISGTALQVAWLLIEASVILSLALVAYQTWKGMSEEGRAEEKIEKTPLFGIGYMFAAMMAVNIIIMVVNMIFGKSIEIPDGMDTGNTPAALLEFADAAVWEEVISRLVPIGIPMAIVALANRKKGWPAYILGGFGLSKLAVALILISSLMFGFAHMSGWGILKVAPTFFTGMMMGWLYCRFGIHASIAFHFLVDYLAVISYTGLQIPISLATLVVMAVGFVALGLIILRLRSIREDVKALPDWMPDQESIFCRRGRD